MHCPRPTISRKPRQHLIRLLSDPWSGSMACPVASQAPMRTTPAVLLRPGRAASGAVRRPAIAPAAERVPAPPSAGAVTRSPSRASTPQTMPLTCCRPAQRAPWRPRPRCRGGRRRARRLRRGWSGRARAAAPRPPTARPWSQPAAPGGAASAARPRAAGRPAPPARAARRVPAAGVRQHGLPYSRRGPARRTPARPTPACLQATLCLLLPEHCPDRWTEWTDVPEQAARRQAAAREAAWSGARQVNTADGRRGAGAPAPAAPRPRAPSPPAPSSPPQPPGLAAARTRRVSPARACGGLCERARAAEVQARPTQAAPVASVDKWTTRDQALISACARLHRSSQPSTGLRMAGPVHAGAAHPATASGRRRAAASARPASCAGAPARGRRAQRRGAGRARRGRARRRRGRGAGAAAARPHLLREAGGAAALGRRQLLLQPLRLALQEAHLAAAGAPRQAMHVAESATSAPSTPLRTCG